MLHAWLLACVFGFELWLSRLNLSCAGKDSVLPLQLCPWRVPEGVRHCSLVGKELLAGLGLLCEAFSFFSWPTISMTIIYPRELWEGSACRVMGACLLPGSSMSWLFPSALGAHGLYICYRSLQRSLGDTGSQDKRAAAQKAVILLEPDVLTLELLVEWRAPAMSLCHLLPITAIRTPWDSRMGCPERYRTLNYL